MIYITPAKIIFTKDLVKVTNLSQNFIVLIPLRFRKAGTLWCGGAKETREPRVTIG